MGLYRFNCPECKKHFNTESNLPWAVDQTAMVICQAGKPTKCLVYCAGEAELAPPPPPVPQPNDREPASSTPSGPSATPTIALAEEHTGTQIAYLEVQSTDGGIHRLPVVEGVVQTYGRKSDFDMCDYPIPSEDKKMSRLHFQIDCRVHNRRPSYILSDCGSVHGTRVTRQTEEHSYVLQLFASKQNKELQDGVCLEPNDFIMAGVTILRFGIDQATDTSVNDGTDAQAGQYDPNKTTVFD
jgi:hypothetical protein